MIRVSLHNMQDQLPVDEPLMKRVAELFCKEHAIKPKSLEITFVDEETSSRLHQAHFNDPLPTDCMTFPVDPPFEEGSEDSLLGEIVICPALAKIQAEEYKTNYKKELMRYLVHGLLHLIGYNDSTENERLIMREQEELFLNHYNTKLD